jgi:patatin-related protein
MRLAQSSGFAVTVFAFHRPAAVAPSAPMREKELRLALICYGGVSLAVYMHGITKEVWRLARASQAQHDPLVDSDPGDDLYRVLLTDIESEFGLKLRVLVDVIAGASAGGINGIFLGQAIATGQSLEPLTDLWLRSADVEMLLDPDARPLSRFTKLWAVPIAWFLTGRRGGTVERTVELGARKEVRSKLSNFVRARWFQPPFGGKAFDGLLLDAFDAMAEAETGPPLLPPEQPLDLFVTVTDFHGHPQRLRLHSPEEVVETEHRLILPFSDRRTSPRHLGDPAELVFAARATASFPGAFPPFTVVELDKVLASRQRQWPGRDAFLARALPHQTAIGAADKTVLIDGSVLANAPFRPAISALRDRPARREIERRFVYIDPTPNMRAVRLPSGKIDHALPGFFMTIFGALSDIPREQPIRDNLDAIEARSSRIRRTARIINAIRPEVEQAIEVAFGKTLFLNRPTPARLSAWRAKAQDMAARQSGYAYASYGHLKLSGVVEESVGLLHDLLPPSDRASVSRLRAAIWNAVRDAGIADVGALSVGGATDAVIQFFRNHDLGFRIRRLRLLAQEIEKIGTNDDCPREAVELVRTVIFDELSRYLARQMPNFYQGEMVEAARKAFDAPQAALETLAKTRDLKIVDDEADTGLANALAKLPRPERRRMLLAYLGFPFYDIATLPLLVVDGQDEFQPIKVDRIAPEDAAAIRAGGAQAALKGIQFNNFGAFFSRAYRENDYLWGRLHGAERLVDIVISALPQGKTFPAGRVLAIKNRLFRSIIRHERTRLLHIAGLFEQLEREIG